MAARKWDVHKSEMERLYITEGKTLKELMQLMKTTHGFSATKYQYEQKIKEWGFKKYRVGAKKWEFIDHRLEKMEAKREITRGKDFSGKRKWESQVYIDGILYPPKRVKYEISRKVFRSTIDKITSVPSPSTPEGVVVCSPEPPRPAPLEIQKAQNLPWLRFSRTHQLEDLQVSPSFTKGSTVAHQPVTLERPVSKQIFCLFVICFVAKIPKVSTTCARCIESYHA